MIQYMDFITQIPDEVLQNTETYLCSNIALFKPNTYMGEVKLNVKDYHIVLPSEKIPDTFFNEQIIHADQRKILTINPGDTVFCLKEIPVKPYYSFMIKPDFLHKIAEEMSFSGKIIFKSIANPFSSKLLLTLKNFEQELKRSDRLNMMLDSLEIQIATLLLREFKTNIKKMAPPSQDIDSYIQIALDYIQTYFSSNITIHDICDEIHVSPYHFIRMFKQKVGFSPHRYLLKVRMEKAKELLKSQRYSVAETAAICGFVSIPHFSATFKESTGCSPICYKSRH